MCLYVSTDLAYRYLSLFLQIMALQVLSTVSRVVDLKADVSSAFARWPKRRAFTRDEWRHRMRDGEEKETIEGRKKSKTKRGSIPALCSYVEFLFLFFFLTESR